MYVRLYKNVRTLLPSIPLPLSPLGIRAKHF